MIRLLIYGLGIYAAYRALKSRSTSFFETGDVQAPGEDLPAGEDLIRDPQCGVYFLKQRGLQTTIDGEQLHFCSQECRDEYLEHHQPG